MPFTPERQPSQYSLPQRGVERSTSTYDDMLDNQDPIDDAASDVSSRSDQSEEAAGLVSRLSDENDRATRRAKYEGNGTRLGTKAMQKAALQRDRISSEADDDDDDLENSRRIEQSNGEQADETDREASIAPSDIRDGLFRDRQTDDALITANTANGSTHKRRRRHSREGLCVRTWKIAREALPTLSVSLCSLVLSGELLIHLAKWPVFSKVDKLFILIPILLNLKGNLEGNLSLRMSTSANIGELDVRRTRETLIFGNMALLQVQALIVSLFAGILSFTLGLGTETSTTTPGSGGGGSKERPSIRHFTPRRVIHHHPGPLDPALKLRNSYFEFVLVIATAMLAASTSSAILGSFMCALVVVTRQLGGNPDNIASPLAGSLGDLLTLSLLGLLASFLTRFEGTILATLILVALAIACAVFFLAAYRNAYVRELLSSGWIPLLIAMFISSAAGLVLDAFVQKFEGFALLVPVVTGLPGAVAAIFVSRTSTALHGGAGHAIVKPRQTSFHSTLQRSKGMQYVIHAYDWLARIGGPAEGWTVPVTLFAIGMAVTMTFIVLVRVVGQMTFGIPFLVMFSICSGVQFAFSLVFAHYITIALWRYDYDPDIYCFPYVTSIVDVIGQVLLVIAYYGAIAMGDKISAAVNNGH